MLIKAKGEIGQKTFKSTAHILLKGGDSVHYKIKYRH
jgi:hypothetical protein